MSSNTNLTDANKAKNEKFYTKLTDIEKELKMFAGKDIYCNCDNPVKSNFVQWFYMRFNSCNGVGYDWNSDFTKVDPKSIDISKDIEKYVKKLNGDGDLRSDEYIDIVITNPPFSLLREYVAQWMEYKK